MHEGLREYLLRLCTHSLYRQVVICAQGYQTYLPTIHLNLYPLQAPHLPLHKYKPVLAPVSWMCPKIQNIWSPHFQFVLQTWSLSSSPGAPLLLRPVLGKGMSDCFFVILRLNPACPVLASRRIRLAKAVVLPCDPILLSPDDPNDRVILRLKVPDPDRVILRLKAPDPDRVILRLKSPTERRSRRWNARSGDARRSRVIKSSKSTESEGMELTGERPTRGNGMSDWRFEGASSTSGLTVMIRIRFPKVNYHLVPSKTTNLIWLIMEHCVDSVSVPYLFCSQH